MVPFGIQRTIQLLCSVVVAACAPPPAEHTDAAPIAEKTDSPEYAGAKSCRPCHEKFYQLWATSFHGTAMQIYSEAFARQHLHFNHASIQVGDSRFTATPSGVLEKRKTAEKQRHLIKYVLGGKYVYYFLTPLERGRLQVLPIGFDTIDRKWIAISDSGVHTTSREETPIHWRSPVFTFNTSCYGCHVSQIETNYSAKTDTYHTTWNEPGINCETCHGPCGEHVRVCNAAARAGAVPDDFRIVRGGRGFSKAQNNHACLSCHSKLIPLNSAFQPGNDLFDHFDVVLLESDDYYPDGRDKRENYTFASWGMSACAATGQLDCLHCHTSSGRFKHRESPDKSCAPCHQKKLESIASHSHHTAGDSAPGCVDCHMPTTTFTRMHRSDHSMRPPSPAATAAFDSPNACTQCHTTASAGWADAIVRGWHGDRRSDEMLEAATHIQNARTQQWSEIGDTLDWIGRHPDEEIFVSSLLRLLAPSASPELIPVARLLLRSKSPLIRASAIQSLQAQVEGPIIPILCRMLEDPSALVRVRSAEALASVPDSNIPFEYRRTLADVIRTHIDALYARTDHAASQWELGNLLLSQRDYAEAIQAFSAVLRMHPQDIYAWIHLALSQHEAGQSASAEKSLERALSISPDNEAALLNMALLKGEQNNVNAAIAYFERALSSHPDSDQAAYNLCILYAPLNWSKARQYCETALRIQPDAPEYAYTFAFYLADHNQPRRAMEILEEIIRKEPDHIGVYALLGTLYSKRNDLENAGRVFQAAAQNPHFSPEQQRKYRQQAQAMQQ
ncbi:MAG: tetratricopeptide repeat protein [Deltaproteobacteria bacterium]|nr:tetratricopeptide repeat protein [Deltaproteobacteria bacterium]MBN2672379.1 tetratricopeptide repeat protein [Deltaproteobacteria bacterium]